MTSFIPSLKKFLIDNTYIGFIYLFLITIILSTNIQISIIESSVVFVLLAIASVIFSFSSLSFSNGNKQYGIIGAAIATLIYFILGIQSFVSYGILHYMSITPILYIPYFYYSYKELRGNYVEKEDYFYIVLILLYILINILYIIIFDKNNIPIIPAIIAILGISIGAYAVIKNDKNVNYYKIIIIASQILVMIGSLFSVIISIINNHPIPGLSIAYVFFPLVIIIPLIKEIIKLK